MGQSSHRFAFSSCGASKHCTEPNFSGGIIWCNGKSIAITSRQLVGKEHVPFDEVVPADFKNAGEKPCLIILEDFLNEVVSMDICGLFTKGNHHRNINVILITQNLLNQGKYCRGISLNAKYVVVF